MIEFPKDFFWGAATSSYQVEGGNDNCDWWEWEARGAVKERSLDACRHYQLYNQDFDIAKSLSHNAHRLSIEWSRIQPEEGKFSEAQLNHYKDVIVSLRQRGLEPIVTLHHFTNPLWLSKKGGWKNKQAQKAFLSYVDYVVSALCTGVRYWVTINEPMVYASHAYVFGVWPPQEKSILSLIKVVDNLAGAHIQAYKLIHKIYKNNNLACPYVSIAKNVQAFVPCRAVLKDRLAVYLRNKFYNLYFVDRVMRHKTLDFIGINYYSRSLVEVQHWGINNLISDVCTHNHKSLKKNYMGWDIYPQGLYEVLMQFKKYNLPLFILENGICTQDDNQRWEFIRDHLAHLHRSIESGCKVIGYIYWSLMDNYEWDKGFSPRFGLVEVDYNTYERKIRESALKFSLVCKTGRL